MAWAEKYVSVAGGGAHDGTSEANAWTLAEAIAAAAAGDRVNVKAGTYANTTTGRTFAVTGTTTAPAWWRGYNTTIGDRDSNPALTPPAITFTTGLCTFGGAHQIFSHLDISGANTARQVNVSGANIKVTRCRVENTNAAAGSHAITNANNGNTFTRCWFKATASATRVFLNSNSGLLMGCAITGGLVGLEASAAVRAVFCAIRAVGSHGFQAVTTGGIHELINCTFRGCAGDGVRFDVLPTTYCAVVNCLFYDITGTKINNATGTNTNVVHREGNDFSTSGTNEAGFGDSPSFREISEASDPHTSASNLSLVTGASAKAGAGWLFENESYTTYLDSGAVQRLEAGAGGAASLIGGNLVQ